MSEPMTWDPPLVRRWLESRIASSRLDQAAADKRGYDAQDDYDKAAAEEWVCRALQATEAADDQSAFGARIKALLGQEDYRVTGIYDDRRFDRSVRGHLRKLAKMTKTNEGFANLARYQ